MAEVTNINDANSWNITRIAEAFNFGRDTVRKRLRKAGVKSSGKRSGIAIYALADVGPALYEGDSRSELPEFQDPDKMDPKSRKEWFQSENERIKFMADVKQLITDGDHRQDLYDAFSSIVSELDNVPDYLERNGNWVPEQLEQVQELMDIIRQRIYIRVKEAEPDD